MYSQVDVHRRFLKHIPFILVRSLLLLRRCYCYFTITVSLLRCNNIFFVPHSIPGYLGITAVSLCFYFPALIWFCCVDSVETAATELGLVTNHRRYLSSWVYGYLYIVYTTRRHRVYIDCNSNFCRRIFPFLLTSTMMNVVIMNWHSTCRNFEVLSKATNFSNVTKSNRNLSERKSMFVA
jgi:hypothetical protein